MSIQFYQIIHIFTVIMLVAITLGAIAAPKPEQRSRTLMLSGITAVLVLVSGFGLLGLGRFGFPGWVAVKLVIWFLLAALAGVAFRRPEHGKVLGLLATVAVLIAVVMVVVKPF
tara:strand:+ start:44 stop:385 length:342 start_codon:yes stop_codon:yes gene_type:complete